VGQQPIITTLSSVGTIFVRCRSENVFNGGVELDVHVVDKFRSCKREMRIQDLGMKAVGREHIFHCKCNSWMSMKGIIDPMNQRELKGQNQKEELLQGQDQKEELFEGIFR